MRYVLALTIAAVVTVSARQSEPVFIVASIKPNTSNHLVVDPETNPAIGHYWLSYATAAGMIIQAYPPNGFQRIDNLPRWARSEHYDILAKAKPGATPAEQQQMWRALLADRLKLQAHYETQPEQGYRLVFARADRQLGPDVQPSTLDCTTVQPRVDPNNIEATAMKRCAWQYAPTTSGRRQVTGGTTLPDIARVLSAIIGVAVVDATGLQGHYAVKMHWAPPPEAGAVRPDADSAPSIFTAVQEQLGLKLDAATVSVPHLVIDRIEPPSEN